MTMEFKSFSKIERIEKASMVITQKIHGTNAQICVLPTEAGGEFPLGAFVGFHNEVIEVDGKKYAVRAGSRSRWIFPGDDNYGFAAFVRTNAAAIVATLGPGTHYGEWAGPGINSGEGLTEKTFVLFDWWKYPEGRALPPQTRVVPVLYRGSIASDPIEKEMAKLRLLGSALVPGFMRPEGIVVTIGGTRYKKVFEAEDTQWTKSGGSGAKIKPARADYSHLLQPVRLEKLLSRDERFLRDYPESMAEVVKLYFEDLVVEGQISESPDEIKAIRKGASGQIFAFVRSEMADLAAKHGYGGENS